DLGGNGLIEGTYNVTLCIPGSDCSAGFMVNLSGSFSVTHDADLHYASEGAAYVPISLSGFPYDSRLQTPPVLHQANAGTPSYYHILHQQNTEYVIGITDINTAAKLDVHFQVDFLDAPLCSTDGVAPTQYCAMTLDIAEWEFYYKVNYSGAGDEGVTYNMTVETDWISLDINAGGEIKSSENLVDNTLASLNGETTVKAFWDTLAAPQRTEVHLFGNYNTAVPQFDQELTLYFDANTTGSYTLAGLNADAVYYDGVNTWDTIANPGASVTINVDQYGASVAYSPIVGNYSVRLCLQGAPDCTTPGYYIDIAGKFAITRAPDAL
ncbi:MAG: hypothetical protein OEZ43_20525, partial [Gammaproteobacteria bacterium]|nr:hypothetical protein [Gammaproteobacteria bacterium]